MDRMRRLMGRMGLGVLAGLAALAFPVGCASERVGGVPEPRALIDGQQVEREAYAVVDGEIVDVPEIRMGEPETVRRVLDEAIHRSQIMDHMRHLTQEIGPRLTASSQVDRANRWAASRFEQWGLSGVRLEQWGEASLRFDRGPSTGKVLLRFERGDETMYREVGELEFTTLAWTRGTDGPVRAPVVRMPGSIGELEEIEQSLGGAWVLIPTEYTGRRGIRGVARTLRLRTQQREEMRDRLDAGEAIELAGEGQEGQEQEGATEEEVILARVLAAGPAGFISSSLDERVWTTSAPGWRELTSSTVARDIEVLVSEPGYDMINSRLADDAPVEVEFDLAHELVDGPIPLYNTIAEIRGTDPELADEVVIVSAHLDSWDGPGSQGATDNGTGSSVVLESARLLAAAGASPRRTIRFILWTGEEQGLLGSRAHVEMHRDQMERVSAVFVDDGGTNYEGGLHAIEPMRDLLAAATAPVNGRFFDEVEGAWMNVDVRINERMPRGGGSDHAAFNAVGVPGFFWDEVGRANYGYGWHTQNDRFELAIPEYLRQSSACMAITAYNLASAPEMLPRQPEEVDAQAATN